MYILLAQSMHIDYCKIWILFIYIWYTCIQYCLLRILILFSYLQKSAFSYERLCKTEQSYLKNWLTKFVKSHFYRNLRSLVKLNPDVSIIWRNQISFYVIFYHGSCMVKTIHTQWLYIYLLQCVLCSIPGFHLCLLCLFLCPCLFLQCLLHLMKGSHPPL